MEVFHIGICDGDQAYRDELRCMLNRFSIETGCKVKIREYGADECLRKEYENGNQIFHLLIINTEMNGIELAKSILQCDPGVAILFLSNTQEYAYAAWELEALGYFQKPVSYERLRARLSRTIIYMEFLQDYLKEKAKLLHVVVNYKPKAINTDEILFIEKSRNKSLIHGINNEIYACYETLSELHEKLDQNHFLYCHQGYIVNFRMIDAIDKSNVVFVNGMQVPLSKKYYKTFKLSLQDRNQIKL